MIHHWNGTDIIPQNFDNMNGVNYKHILMSSELNLVREDMGNKTDDREHPLNLWMTNFFNYNGPEKRKAFASHGGVNTYCTITPFSDAPANNVSNEIIQEFLTNYTYEGMTSVPWEKDPPVASYHVKSRPIYLKNGTPTDKVSRIIFKDETWSIRYIVEMPAADAVMESKDITIIDMHHGLKEILPIKRLFKFEECLPY